MKSNIVIYYILTTFFLIVAAMYTVWHMISYNGEIEWAGSMALLACSILFAFIAYYLNLHYKKQGGELTEDLLEADIDDGDPEIGEFSPWSWWPIILAGAIRSCCAGTRYRVLLLAVVLLNPLYCCGCCGIGLRILSRLLRSLTARGVRLHSSSAGSGHSEPAERFYMGALADSHKHCQDR